ncbi:MAG: class I SAM-dependent methyltransferase, partial [Methylocystis sp.]
MTQQFIPGIQGAIVRNAASYDDVPYESHPFPQTHPGRLAAAARLFGLEVPPLRTARVLELGCAAGGNLIPLAARFPEARFVGVDLSQRQIDAGSSRIAALKLSNISLRRESLTDLRPKDGTFDYIICDGVYSWVPEPVREAILGIARDNLAPTGVAYISYNVLPGWRLRQTLRDAMALHIPPDLPLQAQIAKSRELLSFLEQHTSAESSWGRIFRSEAAQLRQSADYYIAHEFLEQCNEPCSFSEFMRAAEKFCLAYLGEVDVSTMLPENMNPAAAPLLRGLAGDQQVALEQHIDIFTGRTFRQSLLVHKAREAQIVRRLLPPVAEGLNFLARPSFAFAGEEDGQAVFTDATGARFFTDNPTTRKAVEALVARLPASSSIDELGTALSAQGLRLDAETRADVADALLK